MPSTTDFADTRLRDELVRQKRLLDAERESMRERSVQMNEERMALEADRAAFEADRAAAIAAAVAAAQAQAAAEAEAEAAAAAAQQPSSPPRSPRKHRHIPPSPSPLSPHKPHPHRTPGKPGVHVAVRRKPPRTPLSRLVLERAVLDRDRRKLSGSSSGGSTRGVGAKLAASAKEARRPAPAALASAGSSSSSEERSSLSPVLTDSARDNLDNSKGKARDVGDKPEPTQDKQDNKATDKEAPKAPLRKSSLFASTAASAARAKGDKVLSGGARGTQAPGKPARAWR